MAMPQWLDVLRTQHGIKLRDANAFGLPGWVRLVVREPAAQDALIASHNLFPMNIPEIMKRKSAPSPQGMQQLIDLYAAGQLVAAEAKARQFTRSYPDHAFAWKVLGSVLDKMGNLSQALACKQKAASLTPNDAEAHHNLGNAWMKAGQFSQAQASYERVVALRPQFAEAYRTLGNALLQQGLFGGAEVRYRKALALDPQDADSHNNLGTALQKQNHVDEALAHYGLALQCNPQLVSARVHMASALCDLGRLEEAIAHYRLALAQQPENSDVHSQLLFCLLHHEALSPAQVHRVHLAFGQQYEAPLRANWQPHTNTRDPQRRLRVGFVSGDLRTHAVAHFIAPVWAALNPHTVEIWAYSNYPWEDAVSARLRGYARSWRNVFALGDEALAQQIQGDGIDILVDLSGHTAYNRLMVFARKPAPLQATWIGYPGTTGLSSIDYLICDRFNAPHGLYEHYYTEKFARLPSSGAFAPSLRAPPLNPLPALKNGYVTFGSFNKPIKLGLQVIEVWSQVLTALPDSRLLLGNVDDAVAQHTLVAQFGQFGVAAARLTFHPRVPMGRYLALHQEIDIALDTWPYTGGTTSNHALWMGVPVLTMRGPSRAHCQSAAALGRIGLDDWIADDARAFVRLALGHAKDLPALASLRSSMRQRWLTSPWRNNATIAKGLEAGLREMWRRWCAGLDAAHFDCNEGINV